MSLKDRLWLILLGLLVGVALSIHDARSQAYTIDGPAGPPADDTIALLLIAILLAIVFPRLVRALFVGAAVLLAILFVASLTAPNGRSEGYAVDETAKPVPVLRKIPAKGPTTVEPYRQPVQQVRRTPSFQGATRCIQEPGHPLRCE